MSQDTTLPPTEQEREKFEAWADPYEYNLDQYLSLGQPYVDSDTEAAWQAWQARAAIAAQAQQASPQEAAEIIDSFGQHHAAVQKLCALGYAWNGAAAEWSQQAQQAQGVPEGFVLVKKSRLDAIKELAVDPSEPCYEGRGLYDDGRVRANWNLCTSRLEEIRSELMSATEWGHDAAELEAAMLDAALQAEPQPEREPLSHGQRTIGFGESVLSDSSPQIDVWHSACAWTEQAHGIGTKGAAKP